MSEAPSEGMLGSPEESRPEMLAVTGDRSWLERGLARSTFGYSKPILDASSIVSPSHLSLDPAVIGTNFLLALLFFLIIGTSCSVFSNVLEDYRGEMHRFIQNLPILSLLYDTGETERLRRTVILAAVLVLTGLIQAYISPDFSLFTLENIGMWIVTTVSVIVASYTKDIVRFLVAKVWRCRALFQAHLMGIALALICVIVSRTFDIAPGFLFGIPIGFYVYSQRLEDNEGFLEWLGILTMFAGGIASWVLALFLTKYEVLHDLLILLIVVLIEGAFFELFPFNHVPGAAIRAWRPWVWGGTFVFGIFLLLHTLFNPESSLVALEGSISRTALTILGSYAALSFALWGWLRIRERTQEL